MSIQIKCPNGHTLKVKDEFAGRQGLCPHCNAKVQVPLRRKLDDDDVIDFLGKPKPPEDLPVHQGAATEGSGIGASSSSVIRKRTKICSNCRAEILQRYDICPHCHMYFTDGSEISRRLSNPCAKCGTELDRHARSCPICGTAVPS